MKIKKSDKILIAGAHGMAGKAIVKALRSKGYGNKELNGELYTPSRKELDFSDNSKLNIWLKNKKPNVVIIAAAKVGGILANQTYPTEFLLNNLKIQINLIESSWKLGVRRLLFLGSSCIYPKVIEQPIREEYLLKSELEKTNEPYALAKITGIKLCEYLRKQYKFDAISLMPTNLYGPGDNYKNNESHVFAALIRRFHEAKLLSSPSVQCWGTGEPLREFLHATDLGEAAVFVLENWDPDSNNAPKDHNGNSLLFLNVGCGEEISIKNLSLKIAKEYNYHGKIEWDKTKPDGTKRKILDVSKINSLGWKSRINLDEGIKDTVKNFLVSKYSELRT